MYLLFPCTRNRNKLETNNNSSNENIVICYFPAHETETNLEMNNNSSNENTFICYFPAHETETHIEMNNNSSNENSFTCFLVRNILLISSLIILIYPRYRTYISWISELISELFGLDK